MNVHWLGVEHNGQQSHYEKLSHLEKVEELPPQVQADNSKAGEHLPSTSQRRQD